jgi:hypothetical protein
MPLCSIEPEEGRHGNGPPPIPSLDTLTVTKLRLNVVDSKAKPLMNSSAHAGLSPKRPLSKCVVALGARVIQEWQLATQVSNHQLNPLGVSVIT